MKAIFLFYLVVVFVLMVGSGGADYGPITMREDANITLDGGHIINFSTDLYVNVKEFGAVGDNSTDATASVNAAIASGDGKSITVYFPDGRYNISTLVIPEHGKVILQGSGWHGWYAIDGGSLLVHKSNTTNAAIVWNNTGGAEGDSYLVIRDLGIIGDQTSTGHGIYIKNGYNYFIEHCMVSGFVGANVYLDTCGLGVISQNRIYYAKNNSTWDVGGAAIYALDCGDWQITGNDIGNAVSDLDQCHGLYLPGSSGQVIGNKIFNSKWGIYTGGGILAIGNWINDVYEYAFFLTGGDSLVQANFVQSIGAGPFSATWTGIALSPGSTNNTIIGNRITVTSGLAGIYVNGGQQTIEGNNCNLPIYWPRVVYMDAIPTSGYYARGSVVWFTDATAGQPPGAVCVSAGDPATWKNMTALAK